MSISRKRTIIAEICDVIETTPLNEPDCHGLAKKIYELVVKKTIEEAIQYGDHYGGGTQQQAIDDFLKMKV